MRDSGRQRRCRWAAGLLLGAAVLAGGCAPAPHPEQAQARLTSRGMPDEIKRIVFNSDGTLLAAQGGTSHPVVKVWNASTGEELASHDGPWLLASCPDGKILCNNVRNDRWGIVDASTGEALFRLDPQPKGGASAIAVSPDGKVLALGGRRTTLVKLDVVHGRYKPTFDYKDMIQCYDATTGRDVRVLETVAGSPWRELTFSPDGKRLVTLGYAGPVRVFDASDGHQLLALKVPGEAGGVAVSPDGTLIASGSSRQVSEGPPISTEPAKEAIARAPPAPEKWHYEGRAYVWDATSGQEMMQLPTKRGGVRSVAFSADGRFLAGAGGEAVEIWDVKTRQVVLTLSRHTHCDWCMAFSPDGTRLAVAQGEPNRPGEIKVWDVGRSLPRRR